MRTNLDDVTDDSPEFDPFNFPADLISLQLRAATLYAELHEFQKTLPWSRVPHEGWQATGQGGGLQGYESSRPQTDGWTAEQGATYEQLFDGLRKATAEVQAHHHWHRCAIDITVRARMALKHAEGAVPARKTEAPPQAA